MTITFTVSGIPKGQPARAKDGPAEDLAGGTTATATHPESAGEARTQIGAGVVREAPVDAGEACVCDAAGAAASSVRTGDVLGQSGPPRGPSLLIKPWPHSEHLRGLSRARSVASFGGQERRFVVHHPSGNALT